MVSPSHVAVLDSMSGLMLHGIMKINLKLLLMSVHVGGVIQMTTLVSQALSAKTSIVKQPLQLELEQTG